MSLALRQPLYQEDAAYFHDMQRDSLTPEDSTNTVKVNLAYRTGALAVSLAVRQSKYQERAAN